MLCKGKKIIDLFVDIENIKNIAFLVSQIFIPSTLMFAISTTCPEWDSPG